MYCPDIVRKENQCKLYCRIAGTAIYFKLKDKVIDGTPCNQETKDICVDGKCLVSYTFYKNVIYELMTTSQRRNKRFHCDEDDESVPMTRTRPYQRKTNDLHEDATTWQSREHDDDKQTLKRRCHDENDGSITKNDDQYESASVTTTATAW